MQIPPDEIRSHVTEEAYEHIDIIQKQLGGLQAAISQGAAVFDVPASDPQATTLVASLTEKISQLEASMSEVKEQYEAISRRVNQLPASTPHSAEGATAFSLPNMSDIPSKIRIVEQKANVFEPVVAILKRELASLTTKVEAYERERRSDRQKLEELEEKVQYLERQMAMKEVQITEHGGKIMAMESSSDNGTLVWKIGEFARKRQEAIMGRVSSIYSPPFCTSKTGIKLSLSI